MLKNGIYNDLSDLNCVQKLQLYSQFGSKYKQSELQNICELLIQLVDYCYSNKFGQMISTVQKAEDISPSKLFYQKDSNDKVLNFSFIEEIDNTENFQKNQQIRPRNLPIPQQQLQQMRKLRALIQNLSNTRKLSPFTSIDSRQSAIEDLAQSAQSTPKSNLAAELESHCIEGMMFLPDYFYQKQDISKHPGDKSLLSLEFTESFNLQSIDESPPIQQIYRKAIPHTKKFQQLFKMNSGFDSKAMESHYFRATCQLLRILSTFAISCLKINTENSSSFLTGFTRTVKLLRKLEESKNNQPMFSQYCNDLSSFCDDIDTINSQQSFANFSNKSSDYDNQMQQQVLYRLEYFLAQQNRIQSTNEKQRQPIIEPKTRLVSINRNYKKSSFSVPRPVKDFQIRSKENSETPPLVKIQRRKHTPAEIYQNRAAVKLMKNLYT